ncbi:MAG: dihydrodipicolinate synthase family protein [Armatimonadota bacterium]|nr:dihydrodipicolinate synthase family protein [Armatimonadota bacterium]MDR7452162.1 dihydrodipicolinate synthase family protein [Armatimonadota bacterium]MDR7468071.1 dihydrodipicolinate synthase family protein [Armatimonadota bacterium]MDR7494888.1 dihydrodipicolinate synthase family protein [Armatimonadota bacterium]MDR7500285.1 dihydrodipicolinate synthase family protein [Armatimonadota bacterium]
MAGRLPRPRDYARVFQAASESEAALVERILLDAGIPVLVRSRQVPMYAEVIRGASGIWGDVLVPLAYEEPARRYVAEYLRQMKEAGRVSRFGGIIPPLVTLFDQQGRIDEDANRAHLDFVIAGGVHGVFALGSTGEAMHLTAEERRAFTALVVRHTDGRVPVLVGCLSTATEEAVALARYAEEIGADGVIVIPPYYWTPNDQAIEMHIGAVAEAVTLPVLIYNFPAVVGRSIPAPLVARLATAHDNVLGIKETIDSISHIHEVIARIKPRKPEFSVLCGYEFHLLNTLLSGGDGAIPAVANVAPAPPVAIYEHWRAGRLAEAAAVMRQRLELATLYQLDAPFFVVIKEAMAMLGRIAHPTVRAPAPPLSEEHRLRLRELLTAAGLL